MLHVIFSNINLTFFICFNVATRFALFGVKDTEPPTCRTAATQLVAVGRLLR
jgi:hypothetical protein